MKKFILTGLLIFLMSTLHAQEGREGFGVGVIVGEPTGISIKTWTGNTTAIQAAAAWSFSGYNSFQFHLDYLFHNFSLFNSEDMNGALPVYIGVGGRLKLAEDADPDPGNDDVNDEAAIGLRVPLGISYIFGEAPLDVFLEVVPILDVVPDTDFDLNGAVGIRVYL
ncbi:MAG: BAPKO_0422 family outer member beta-barrel protein [Bacteroidales bacterium]